jgi:hypothetical protein
MISSNVVNFKLSENEYGYNTEYTEPCGAGGTMKLYIPKLMSKIGFGAPKSIPEKFPVDTIFLNSSECKPSASNYIRYINYISVPLEYNSDWKHKINKDGFVPKKSKFLCSFINGDITKPRFTTNI